MKHSLARSLLVGDESGAPSPKCIIRPLPRTGAPLALEMRQPERLPTYKRWLVIHVLNQSIRNNDGVIEPLRDCRIRFTTYEPPRR